MGSTAGFAGLGEAFAAAAPAGVAAVPEEVPETAPEEVRGEDAGGGVFRAAGGPLLAEASGDTGLGLASEPAVLGAAVRGAASFSAFSGLGGTVAGTVGKRPARISAARAVPD